MQFTQLSLQQNIDYLTATTITISESPSAIEHFKQQQTNIQSILAQIPDIPINYTFDLTNKNGKIETQQLQLIRCKFLQINQILPISMAYQTQAAQSVEVIAKLDTILKNAVKGDMVAAKLSMEYVPSLLYYGENGFLANPLVHIHFSTSNEPIEDRLKQLRGLRDSITPLLQIPGFTDSDILLVFCVVATQPSFEIEEQLKQAAQKQRSQVFVISPSDKMSETQIRPLYSPLISPQSSLPPLIFNGFVQFWQGFASTYCTFLRDKIQMLSAIFYDSKQLIKKETNVQAFSVQPKQFYLQWLPEQRLMRLIDLLLQHQMFTPAELYIGEYLSKFGKSSKYAASEALYARFLNSIGEHFMQIRQFNAESLTNAQREQIIGSLKAAVLQINECFQISSTNSNYNYNNTIMTQPIYEVLRWEQRKDFQYSAFKCIASQHRAILQKIGMEIMYGLTFLHMMQKNLLPSSHQFQLFQNVQFIHTVFARRDDPNSYLSGLCWFYSSEIVKELIQRNEQMQSTKQNLIQMSYKSKKFLYYYMYSWHIFLLNKDVALAYQLSQVMKNFNHFNYSDPLKKLVLSYAINSTFTSQTETLQSYLLDYVGKQCVINFNLYKSQPYKSTHFIENIQLSQVNKDQVINLFNILKMNIFKAQNIEVFLRNISESLQLLPTNLNDVDTCISFDQSTHLVQWYNSLTEKKYIDPFKQDIYLNTDSPYHPLFKIGDFIQIDSNMRQCKYALTDQEIARNQIFNSKRNYPQVFDLNSKISISIQLNFTFPTLIRLAIKSVRIFSQCKNKTYESEIQQPCIIDKPQFNLIIRFSINDIIGQILEDGTLHIQKVKINFTDQNYFQEIDVQKDIKFENKRINQVTVQIPASAQQYDIVQGKLVLPDAGEYYIGSEILDFIYFDDEEVNSFKDDNANFTIPEHQMEYLIQKDIVLKYDIAKAHVRRKLYDLVMAKYETNVQSHHIQIKEPCAINFILYAYRQFTKQEMYFTILNSDRQLIRVQFSIAVLSETQQKYREIENQYIVPTLNQTVSAVLTETNLKQQVKINVYQRGVIIQPDLTPVLAEVSNNNLQDQNQNSNQSQNQSINQNQNQSQIENQCQNQNTNLNKIQNQNINQSININQNQKQLEQFLNSLPYNLKQYKTESTNCEAFSAKAFRKFAKLLQKQSQEQIYQKILLFYGYIQKSFNMSYKDNKEAKEALEKAARDLQSDLKQIQEQLVEELLNSDKIDLVVGVFIKDSKQKLFLHKINVGFKIPYIKYQIEKKQLNQIVRMSVKLINLLRFENLAVKIKVAEPIVGSFRDDVVAKFQEWVEVGVSVLGQEKMVFPVIE